jgi:Protein of unknown function (DUF4058)
MPTPFPGMDPYLEDPFFWHQVHSQLIVALSHDLGSKLRPKYYAAIEISGVKKRYLEIRQVGTHESIATINLLPPKNHQFQVLVSTLGDRSSPTLYTSGLREVIPVFLLPLRSEDEAIPVDLGRLLKEVYDQACFDLQVDYSQPVPEPMLSAEDAVWVQLLLDSSNQPLT